MVEINAARLRLRAPDGWSVRAQARVEDALRTGAPDDGRLMVIRRLDLGRLPLAGHPARWSEQAGKRLSALAARAVHGSLPGAVQAEAVWFASPAEAQRLLLAELAAGRTPFAWYWRLALPGWRGAALADWLPRLVEAAEADPEAMVELARAVAYIAGQGHLPVLVDALPAAMRAAATMPPRLASSQPEREQRARSRGGAARTAARLGTPQTDDAASAATVQRLFDRLPVHFRSALATLLDSLPSGCAAVRLFGRLALLHAAPELAASSSRLAELVAQLPNVLRRRLDSDAPAPPDAPAAATLAATARRTDAGGAGTSGSATSLWPAADSGNLVHRDAPHAPPIVPAALTQFEQRTAAAGLWLLIRPLHVMGLGEWLDARPGLAADGFARALLHQIAERQRVAATDPLFAILGDPFAELPGDLLSAWRVGIDRWLRKATRRKLAAVVGRPGWLLPREAGVAVRFRVDQADVALRRRALDVDAGWVPWLGLSVRYHYRDEPLA